MVEKSGICEKDEMCLHEILHKTAQDVASVKIEQQQNIQAINQLLQNADPDFVAALMERLIKSKAEKKI